MRKKTKLTIAIIFAAIFVGFFVLFSVMNFTTSDSNPYEFQGTDNGWIITDTTIDIKVNKDRTATVTEQYTVNFIEPSYSMYRALPLTQNERYYDISAKANSSSSPTISIDTGIFSDAGNNFLVVYIDLPSKVTGAQFFELSYKIIPRTDFNVTDRYYMNAVGYGWTTSQTNVSVSVQFPNNINSDQSKIYAGKWADDAKLDPAKYTIKDNVLSISDVSLEAYNGITIDISLPKNTFDLYFDFYILIGLAVGVILLFIIFILKVTKAKNEPLTPIVNFYPPKDENGRELTPLELGYLIDNNTDPEDVTSMIYYFASKGFLKIVQEGEKQILLEKTKDLPPNVDKSDQVIFNAIFAGGNTATIASMEKTFPSAVQSAKSSTKAKFVGKTFEKRSTPLAVVAIIILLVVSVIYCVLANFRILPGNLGLPVPLIISLVAVFSMGTYICQRQHKMCEKSKMHAFVGYGVVALIAAGVSVFLMSGAAMGYLERAILVGFSMIAAMIAPFLVKRTDYYTKRLNDILGFKEYLDSVQKDKLETMLEGNPNYYYDILPYANVLGVSDIWQNKFESLTIPQPTYYYSTNSSFVFNFIVFNSIFRSSTRSITSAVHQANKAKFSSRGGFGGGGGSFGGGGFGGGGGGRR